MSVYTFLRGVVGLGVGTANQGLLRSHAVPIDSNASPRDIPRRSLGPVEGAFAYTGKRAFVTSLTGNGSEIHGTFAMQPLAVRKQ